MSSSERRLAVLLRGRDELPQAARLRLAFDALREVAARGDPAPLFPRAPESVLRLDGIVLSDEGEATIEATAGDASGAALLVWELLAQRPTADCVRPGRVHEVTDEIHPDIDDTVQRALHGEDELDTAAALLAELDKAAVCVTIGERIDVLRALGLAPPAPPPVVARPPSVVAPPVREGVAAPEPPAAEPAPTVTPVVPAAITQPVTQPPSDAVTVRPSAPPTVPSAEVPPAPALPVVEPRMPSKPPSVRPPKQASGERLRPGSIPPGPSASMILPRLPRLSDPVSPAADVAGARVLVIGDDWSFAGEIAEALGTAGFSVQRCEEPENAIAATRDSRPKCIVCDVDVAGGEGAAVGLSLRRAGFGRAPFLLLRSADGPATLEGVDVALRKPVSTPAIVAQVTALVRMALRLSGARRRYGEPVVGERALEGELAQISIATLLSILDLERRTGQLELRRGAHAIVLEISGGAVVTTQVDGAESLALDAIKECLTWREGRFAFNRAPVPPVEGGVALSALLMEATRQQDEAEHGLTRRAATDPDIHGSDIHGSGVRTA